MNSENENAEVAMKPLTAQSKPLTRFDIEKRADRKDRMMLQDSAAYVVFRYALERGWITEAERDQAERHYGNLWNYCGD